MIDSGAKKLFVYFPSLICIFNSFSIWRAPQHSGLGKHEAIYYDNKRCDNN